MPSVTAVTRSAIPNAVHATTSRRDRPTTNAATRGAVSPTVTSPRPAGTANPAGRACTAASARNDRPATRDAWNKVSDRRSSRPVQARNRGEPTASATTTTGGVAAASAMATGTPPGAVRNIPSAAAPSAAANQATAMVAGRTSARGYGASDAVLIGPPVTCVLQVTVGG